MDKVNLTEFADKLTALSTDRAALAQIKRGHYDKANPQAASIIWPLIPYSASQKDIEAYWMTAILFSRNPQHGAGITLGKALRKAKANSKKESEKGFERTVTKILSTKKEDLVEVLNPVLIRLKGLNMGVDYALLLYDLFHWEHETQFVQLRIAKDFWAEMPKTQPKEKP